MIESSQSDSSTQSLPWPASFRIASRQSKQLPDHPVDFKSVESINQSINNTSNWWNSYLLVIFHSFRPFINWLSIYLWPYIIWSHAVASSSETLEECCGLKHQGQRWWCWTIWYVCSLKGSVWSGRQMDRWTDRQTDRQPDSPPSGNPPLTGRRDLIGREQVVKKRNSGKREVCTCSGKTHRLHPWFIRLDQSVVEVVWTAARVALGSPGSLYHFCFLPYPIPLMLRCFR